MQSTKTQTLCPQPLTPRIHDHCGLRSERGGKKKRQCETAGAWLLLEKQRVPLADCVLTVVNTTLVLFTNPAFKSTLTPRARLHIITAAFCLGVSQSAAPATYSEAPAAGWGSGNLWVGRRRPWRLAGQRAPPCRQEAAWTAGSLPSLPSWHRRAHPPMARRRLAASSARSLTTKEGKLEVRSKKWTTRQCTGVWSLLPWVSCSLTLRRSRFLQQFLKHSMAAGGQGSEVN